MHLVEQADILYASRACCGGRGTRFGSQSAHLLVNGNLAALLLFGAVLVTTLNGMVSIDRKRRRALGALWDEFEAQTSRLPFAAILTGRTRLELTEFHVWQVALAVALFSGVFWLHGIIGPSPLWLVRQ